MATMQVGLQVCQGTARRVTKRCKRGGTRAASVMSAVRVCRLTATMTQIRTSSCEMHEDHDLTRRALSLNRQTRSFTHPNRGPHRCPFAKQVRDDITGCEEQDRIESEIAGCVSVADAPFGFLPAQEHRH